MEQFERRYYQVSGEEPTIFGGTETENPAFTEHAYKVMKNGKVVCSGIEFPYHLDKMVIATSAHCLGEFTNSYAVKGPGKNLTDGEIIPAMGVKLKRVDEAQPFPDFAFLITDKSAKSQLPYSIPTKDLQNNLEVTSVGFGHESPLGDGLSDVLKEAHQTVTAIGPVTNDSICGVVEMKEFCATDGDGSVCIGDSGGGIFSTEADGSLSLIGIIAEFRGECMTGSVGEDVNKWKSQAFLCATDPIEYPTFCELPPNCIPTAFSADDQMVDTTDARPELYLPSVETSSGVTCVNTTSSIGAAEQLPTLQSVSPVMAIAILGAAVGLQIKRNFSKS